MITYSKLLPATHGCPYIHHTSVSLLHPMPYDIADQLTAIFIIRDRCSGMSSPGFRSCLTRLKVDQIEASLSLAPPPEDAVHGPYHAQIHQHWTPHPPEAVVHHTGQEMPGCHWRAH